MSAPRQGFHSITLSHDATGGVVVEMDMFRDTPVDVNNDPLFVGDPPERVRNGGCSRCDRPWMSHWDEDAREWVTPRKFHRRDTRTGELGFYSDEVTEVTQR